MARSGPENDSDGGWESGRIVPIVNGVNAVVLLAAWFLLSVPAAVAVGTALAPQKARARR
jgi:hypothetical protein